MAQNAASKAMAMLEILSSVVQYVKDPTCLHTKDLYNVSLVNKAFYKEAVKQLYACISWRAGNLLGRSDGWDRQKENDFIETIRERPALAKLVKHLHSRFERPPWRDIPEQPPSSVSDILEIVTLCPTLDKVTSFTDDTDPVLRLGAAVGNQIRELEVEWAKDMRDIFAGRVVNSIRAFAGLRSLSLLDWHWEHLLPVVTAVGQGLRSFSMCCTEDGFGKDLTYSELDEADWQSLFSAMPQLERLTISSMDMTCLSTKFPVRLQHLELHGIPGCLAIKVIQRLADPTFLPHLRSLPDIRINECDDYLVSYPADGVYSLESVTYAPYGESETQATGIPSVETIQGIIEAALLGMELRKGWLREEEHVMKFRALAKNWEPYFTGG